MTGTRRVMVLTLSSRDTLLVLLVRINMHGLYPDTPLHPLAFQWSCHIVKATFLKKLLALPKAHNKRCQKEHHLGFQCRRGHFK
jgi:hypothetical protein